MGTVRSLHDTHIGDPDIQNVRHAVTYMENTYKVNFYTNMAIVMITHSL